MVVPNGCERPGLWGFKMRVYSEIVFIFWHRISSFSAISCCWRKLPTYHDPFVVPSWSFHCKAVYWLCAQPLQIKQKATVHCFFVWTDTHFLICNQTVSIIKARWSHLLFLSKILWLFKNFLHFCRCQIPFSDLITVHVKCLEMHSFSQLCMILNTSGDGSVHHYRSWMTDCGQMSFV